MMIFWWIIIVAGLVLLFKWISGQRTGSGNKEDSAIEILKKRYARGEITKEQFEEMKKDLL